MLSACCPKCVLARAKMAGLGLAVLLIVFLGAAQAAQAAPLQQNREKARALAARIAELDDGIAAAVQRYSAATRQLDETRAAIERNRKRLQVARYELALARDTLTRRAVALYKHEDVTSLDVVFGADDFGDLVGHMTMMRRVARSDAELVVTVTRAEKDLVKSSARLAADLRAASKLVAQSETEQKAIRAELEQRRALLAGVNAEIRALLRRQAAAQAKATTKGGASEPSGDLVDTSGWWPLINQAAKANGVSAQGMHRLMMAESGGSPNVEGPGGYHGLFQYAPSTWRGAWNPWRGRSIYDGAAQIRATALALRLGYGPSWWRNTYGWAFNGD